jgi:outer membrane protein assembly factor BamB/tRNA A-37 threonylcarbamoyl transferase component Bud32
MRGVTRRRVLQSGLLIGSTVMTERVASQTGAGAVEWPTFSFDRRNSGRSPAVGPTSSVSAAWRHETGGPVATTPVVASGFVYVGSDDGTLYALDAISGERQWSVETGSRVRSSPTFRDGTIYFGSDDEAVRAVDASGGDVTWTTATDDNVSSSPVVADGTVYVGSEDGRLYAMAAGDGEVGWTVDTGSPITSSPAVAGGTVYVGSADTHLYAIDITTGEVTWRVETGDGIASSPAVVDSTVYVGSGDGYLYALDTGTGEQRWRFRTDGLVGTSPTVANSTVYVANGLFSRRLYAVEAETGNERWMVETDGAVQSSPAVADGLVYFGSGDRHVYAVDADTGNTQWSFETSDLVASSPAVVDGAVYVGSNDGSLYALTDDKIPARVGTGGPGLRELAPVVLGVLGLGGGSAWLLRRRRTDRGQSRPDILDDDGDADGSDTPVPEVEASDRTATDSSADTTATSTSDRARPASQPTADRFPSAPSVSVDYGYLTDREIIGSGGNADVVRATLPTDAGDQTIAVKEPRVAGTIRSDDVERMLSEAEVWSKIDDHDHIVRVLDYAAEPLPWIAMEYMDGGTLAERAGTLDLPQALWAALCITRGVRHAHRKGVAHLDLKPENVLFRESDDGWDVPKVADWGLSRYLLDHSNSVEGLTPQYAAPEQFDEETPTDDITDIYQLGVVFYELLTGQPPFEGRPAEVMQSVLEAEPTPPSEIADLPQDVDQVLLRALATDRSERYDDIVYLRDGLKRLYHDQW